MYTFGMLAIDIASSKSSGMRSNLNEHMTNSQRVLTRSHHSSPAYIAHTQWRAHTSRTHLAARKS